MSGEVNIKYYDNNTLKYDTNQTPGDELDEKKFITGPTISNSEKHYRILYNWLHGQLTAPILVPKVNSNYTSQICELIVPDGTIMILYFNGKQLMDDFLLMNATYPLYFSAYYYKNGIACETNISSHIHFRSYMNKYEHDITLSINDPDYQEGATSNYTVYVRIYKDHLKTKKLGEIVLSVRMTSTIGPGE
ncbi:MAG: hypothetical protein K6E74_05440 [Bacilli bacterium]|nr:hypothetical protein [Bacilli bacterium]